jgi:hypothetical protein
LQIGSFSLGINPNLSMIHTIVKFIAQFPLSSLGWLLVD